MGYFIRYATQKISFLFDTSKYCFNTVHRLGVKTRTNAFVFTIVCLQPYSSFVLIPQKINSKVDYTQPIVQPCLNKHKLWLVKNWTMEHN